MIFRLSRRNPKEIPAFSLQVVPVSEVKSLAKTWLQ
jgi:hypothetical protein